MLIDQLPSNDLQDFGKRNHLIALIQFVETMKLPNLDSLTVHNTVGLSPHENSLFQKFNQAINKFFEKYGQQLSSLRYFYIPPSVVITSFKYLCNLEDLWIGFNDNIPNLAGIIDDIRESFKHIKKLKILQCADYTHSRATIQLHSELIRSMLKENRKTVKKFYLETWHSKFSWIPVNYELQLKEIELRFLSRNGENTLVEMNTYPHRKLESVTKLGLYIGFDASYGWLYETSLWIIATFPNIKNLTLDCSEFRLTLADCCHLIRNLVHLKTFFIKNGYQSMTDQARNWLTRENHTGFIKLIPYNGGMEISISHPLPNNIFDYYL